MNRARQLRDSDAENVVPMRQDADRATAATPATAAAAGGGEGRLPGRTNRDGARLPGSDREAGGLMASLVATLAHFHQWLLLAGAVAGIFVAGRWVADPGSLPADTRHEASRPVVASTSQPPVTSSAATAAVRSSEEEAPLASASPGNLVKPVPEARGSDRQVGADDVLETTPADERHAKSADPLPVATRAGASGDQAIWLESTPPGARVLVDGVPLADETPTRVALRDGARIRLETPGFEPLETTFQPDAGTRAAELDYRLTPLASTRDRVRAPAEVPYPRKTQHVEPTPPASAGSEATGGIVIVTLEIDADGNVIDAALLRGATPSLDRAALDASWRWKFAPTVVDGRPVHVVANFSVPVGRD